MMLRQPTRGVCAILSICFHIFQQAKARSPSYPLSLPTEPCDKRMAKKKNIYAFSTIFTIQLNCCKVSNKMYVALPPQAKFELSEI